MKKMFLMIAIALAVVSSLVVGTMAADTQTLDIHSGNILTKQFTISSDESKSFTQNVKIAPGDSETYKVAVCNDGDVRTAVCVNAQILSAGNNKNTQLVLTTQDPKDGQTKADGTYSLILAPGESSELTFTVSWPYNGEDTADTQMLECNAEPQIVVVINGAFVNECSAAS